MPLAKNIFVLSLTLFLFNGGCREQQLKKSAKKIVAVKELTIYCENTMLNMVLDLKESFERQYNCHIKIQNDCSKNLMGIINYSGKGDIYIPSSPNSFNTFQASTGYRLTDSLFLGYNQLVYMVKKGNPKKFQGHLSELNKKGKFAVIIANPETSSLGSETKDFLKKQKGYDGILQNVVSLTSDSKGLVQGLKSNQADVVVNWQSNLSVNGNVNHIEVVMPNTSYDNTVPIYAASLSCSLEPSLARAFLDLASHELGEATLNKYGFSKRQTIIF